MPAGIPLVRNPLIYEINTWVWLGELSRREGTPVDLASVPPGEWDRVRDLGFDAVWLMGVWERSPAGIAIALQDEGLAASFRLALPDVGPERRRRLALLRPALRRRRAPRR